MERSPPFGTRPFYLGRSRVSDLLKGVWLMILVATGWNFELDRGPDWLFVKLKSPEPDALDAPPLAEAIWSLLEQHFVYRLIVELDELPLLDSYLIGQLMMLHKRVAMHGGLLRLCGLNAAGEDSLRFLRLADALPNYANRGEAVRGHRPTSPR